MKKKLIVLIPFLFISGTLLNCALPTIQWRSATQKQVAKLAVSIGAKAIGLKLAASGFMWTSEIETFYKVITVQDKISLDAAQMAERYIRDSVDPLIAPDILELAKMVGFEFNSAGTVIGTSNVNVELLKVAADGFRLAIVARQKPFTELNSSFSKEGYNYGIYPYSYDFDAYPQGDTVAIVLLDEGLSLYDK